MEIPDNRYVLLEEGYPHTLLLTKEEAEAIKRKMQMMHPDLNYSIFYDEYYEYAEFTN